LLHRQPQALAPGPHGPPHGLHRDLVVAEWCHGDIVAVHPRLAQPSDAERPKLPSHILDQGVWLHWTRSGPSPISAMSPVTAGTGSAWSLLRRQTITCYAPSKPGKASSSAARNSLAVTRSNWIDWLLFC